MPEEITCPECGSSDVKEKKRDEDYYYFECLDCGCEFDESGPIDE